MGLHTNENYNIIQTGSGFDEKCWSVFNGKRLDNGAPEVGAVELKSGLTYNEAKQLADKMQAMLDLSNQTTGKTVHKIAFGHSGKYTNFHPLRSGDVGKGWWCKRSGAEGGELHINIRTLTIDDFDGCMDLPSYVYSELLALGIKID